MVDGPTETTSDGTPMPRHRSGAQVLAATRESLVLAAACLAAYWLAMTLLSRVTAVSHDDLLGGRWAVSAAITTTVVMVVAAISPHNAWEQPILRLGDTVIGVAVGVAAAWLDLRVARRHPSRPAATATSRS